MGLVGCSGQKRASVPLCPAQESRNHHWTRLPSRHSAGMPQGELRRPAQTVLSVLALGKQAGEGEPVDASSLQRASKADTKSILCSAPHSSQRPALSRAPQRIQPLRSHIFSHKLGPGGPRQSQRSIRLS